MDIFDVSHKINEVLLQILGTEKTKDVLFNCMEKMIIIPRFELLAILKILTDHIVKKDKSKSSELSKVLKSSHTWLFSSESSNFSKMWEEENKSIPDNINKLYNDIFNNDIFGLLHEYVLDSMDNEEFFEKINKEKNNYIRRWYQQPKEYVEILDTANKTVTRGIHSNDIDNIRLNNEDVLINQKTFQDKKKEERMLEDKGKVKIKTMADKKVDWMFMDQIDLEKKDDIERMEKIFIAIESIYGDIKDEDKNILRRLWYGNKSIKLKDRNSDDIDILSTINRHSLRVKIPDKQINSSLNKLILQTYIVGLYLELTVLDIFTIINRIVDNNPSLSGNIKILPQMVHDGHVPNIKVQEILNPIIEKTPLPGKITFIRERWNKMRFPEIYIDDLIEYVNKLSIDNSIKFDIRVAIVNLSKNISKRGLTIEKFAKEVYKIINKQSNAKTPIIEKKIVKLLRYSN